MSIRSTILDTILAIGGDAPLKTDTRLLRHKQPLPLVLAEIPGDIVELGAHTGYSTVEYSRIATQFDRQVQVIDPWTDAGQELFVFLENTKSAKNIRLLRCESQNNITVRYLIETKPFAFGFVDGLHTYEGAMSDIRTLIANETQLICIDDVRHYVFSPPIMQAVFDAVKKWPEYEVIETPSNYQEIYLWKKDWP